MSINMNDALIFKLQGGEKSEQSNIYNKLESQRWVFYPACNYSRSHRWTDSSTKLLRVYTVCHHSCNYGSCVSSVDAILFYRKHSRDASAINSTGHPCNDCTNGSVRILPEVSDMDNSYDNYGSNHLPDSADAEDTAARGKTIAGNN